MIEEATFIMSQAIIHVMHNNKSIIVMDYTKCTKAELLNRVQEVMFWIKKQPLNSLLTVTDVSNQHFDNDVIETFKKLAVHNKPYVKAGAIIGITGLVKIAYTVIMKFSGRNMPIFNTREEAMDWLVKQ